MKTVDLPCVPLLTAADEIELARRIEAGVYAEHLLITTYPGWISREELIAVMEDGADAWQHFYTANLRLAALVAHRAARNYRVDVDDIIQECCLSLGRAIRDWDHTRGTRFSTLAWPRLVFTARCACQSVNACGSLPERWLRAKPADAPAQQAQPWRPPLHMIDDELPAPEREPDPSAIVLTQLSYLGAEERRIVEDRFGLRSGKPRSYARIAEDMKTSPYHVKRIETKALEHLGSRVAALV